MARSQCVRVPVEGGASICSQYTQLLLVVVLGQTANKKSKHTTVNTMNACVTHLSYTGNHHLPQPARAVIVNDDLRLHV